MRLRPLRLCVSCFSEQIRSLGRENPGFVPSQDAGPHFGSDAMIRSGAPVPEAIFIGSAMTVAPCDGNS